eukprot:jgi/Mesvir1/14786/Mv05426-RA.1
MCKEGVTMDFFRSKPAAVAPSKPAPPASGPVIISPILKDQEDEINRVNEATKELYKMMRSRTYRDRPVASQTRPPKPQGNGDPAEVVGMQFEALMKGKVTLNKRN